ncbi:MAG: pilus assembly protein PilM [Planctomycetes bacterium]|jgi:Tfp pilus assembly PilM family ATPase|nr:pilus assembly protein PilM [Planctomycetota bacterium]
MWPFRRKSLIGVDLDASAVRMVQLRRDSTGIAFVRASVTDIAPWGNDPQLRRVHTVQALRQGLAAWGSSAQLAVCGLRGPEVVVRGFEFPGLPPEEIGGAVELEVSQICPFLAEESTLDHQVTLSTEQKTLGFWVAATNSLIKNTRQLVSEAGLHCTLVDVAGLALLNLLEYRSQQENDEKTEAAGDGETPGSRGPPSFCTAILNVSDTCATIAIVDPAGRPFVRDIGGSIATESRLPGGTGGWEAEGPTPAQDEWTARSTRRSATSDSLVEDVTTTLRYYAVQNGSVRIDRLLVCGDEAGVAESVDLLRARLSLDVVPWNPLTDCGFQMARETAGVLARSAGFSAPGPGTMTSQEESSAGPASARPGPPWYGPSLAVAAGLAVRQI